MIYPNLQHEKLIALDIETKDSDLRKLGPGYHRARVGLSDDRILSVGIATQEKEWAFPWNQHTKKWLQGNSHLGLIGANILYDLGWLSVYGDIMFTGRMYDILTNESLIDGGRNWYSLDRLSQKYLGIKKGNDEIEAYAQSQKWKGDARAHLWRMPIELVMRYNAIDCRQTYDIFQRQSKSIRDNELERVANIESRLIPVLLRMRETGVRMDVLGMKTSEHYIRTRILNKQAEIKSIVGWDVNDGSGIDMKKAFEELGLRYPLTEKGNSSFKHDVLDKIDHPFPQAVTELRVLKKLQSTYVVGLQKFLVGDRIYGEFIPVKNGTRGTETGRFSSIRPNLQQIPQHGEGKEIIRSLFLPEEGMLWEKQDQSQEEYRIFGHFAQGGGAEELRKNFHRSDFDMHQFMAEFTGLVKSKKDEARSLAKTLNFLSLYGGGVHKFAGQIGLPIPPPWNFTGYEEYLEQKDHMLEHYEAAQIYFPYHDRMPAIKYTAKLAEKKCRERGYAKTLLGRRRYLMGNDAYKALNTTIQGTGGDIMKLWLIEAHEAGLWDTLPLHVTVHDEAGFSIPQTKEGEEAAREVQHIGETVVTLKVPLKVDRENGPNWAEVVEV